MDFIEVEILQRQIVALEDLRHRHGRRHQQAFAVFEIHGGHLRVHQVRLDVLAMRTRPVFRCQQRRRRAIGKIGRVAGRQCALPRMFVEGRLERGEFFQSGIGAQDVVALQAAERHHQVLEETTLVGRGGILVRPVGELVLVRARDLPFLRHHFAMLAHALAGARLADAGELGLEFGKRKSLHDRAQSLAERARHVEVQQATAQLLVHCDRHIGGGIRSAADADLDLAERNLVGDGDHRVQARAAGALQGDARRQRREARGQRGFAAEIPVGGMLEHRAHRHLTQHLALQAEFFDQCAQRLDRHAEVADVEVGGVVLAEGDANAAKNGDTTCGAHGRSLERSLRSAGIMVLP